MPDCHGSKREVKKGSARDERRRNKYLQNTERNKYESNGHGNY